MCVWTQDSENSDIWLSSCGKAFVLSEGTPKENQIKYCVYCGDSIKQKVFKYEGINNGISRAGKI